ncbi:unnamed protein product [Cyprideis torosa]|uniref:MHD domain-containing protein n=1 Tax=Cyprideis torosa TaxID=163714 RepID=A0A7R8W1M3_9CRUS|nr:unnamed protein product [Cyprideis torosa]CAG0879962.1 unnamed protein product [Cyprideis torosa]
MTTASLSPTRRPLFGDFLTTVPWRRMGIQYEDNEAFFDVVEELDVLIDRDGEVLRSEIKGYIDACVRLSGTPDLTMSFYNPKIIENVSFHPSVRFKRWETESVISFIPPDGSFRLVDYTLGGSILPVFPLHTVTFNPPSEISRLNVRLECITESIESLHATMPLPPEVMDCTVVPNMGTVNYDRERKLLVWEVMEVEAGKTPSIKGALRLTPGCLPPRYRPILTLSFTIPRITVSGLRIKRLDVAGEDYKAFKGVKYITKTGKYQIRL